MLSCPASKVLAGVFVLDDFLTLGHVFVPNVDGLDIKFRVGALGGTGGGEPIENLICFLSGANRGVEFIGFGLFINGVEVTRFLFELVVFEGFESLTRLLGEKGET